jgi:hypothetical protein
MSPPPCDRHKNLQMVPFGQTFVHACPVPSCGRFIAIVRIAGAVAPRRRAKVAGRVVFAKEQLALLRDRHQSVSVLI